MKKDKLWILVKVQAMEEGLTMEKMNNTINGEYAYRFIDVEGSVVLENCTIKTALSRIYSQGSIV